MLFLLNGSKDVALILIFQTISLYKCCKNIRFQIVSLQIHPPNQCGYRPFLSQNFTFSTIRILKKDCPNLEVREMKFCRLLRDWIWSLTHPDWWFLSIFFHRILCCHRKTLKSRLFSFSLTLHILSQTMFKVFVCFQSLLLSYGIIVF